MNPTYDNYGLFWLRDLKWGLGQPTSGELDMTNNQDGWWVTFGTQGASDSSSYFHLGMRPLIRPHCLENGDKRLMQITVLNDPNETIQDKKFITIQHSAFETYVGATKLLASSVATLALFNLF